MRMRMPASLPRPLGPAFDLSGRPDMAARLEAARVELKAAGLAP